MQLGKLSSDDLLVLLEIFPILDQQYVEVRKLFAENHDKFLVPGYIKPAWYGMYELPYVEHIARVIVMIGETEAIKALAATENPPKAAVADLVELMSKNDDDEEPLDDADRPFALLMFGYCFSLYLSLKCLLTFGVYLNDLVSSAGLGGKAGDKALFQAIKIDPTVIACTNIINRISLAVIDNDKSFLSKLQRSLSGNLTKREDKTYQRQRLVLQILLETGAPKLTQDDLYELFVQQLKIVAKDRNSDIGDVSNNLRQFAYQFMKQKSVS